MPTPTNYSANLVFGGRVDSSLDKAVQQIEGQLRSIHKEAALFSENIAAVGTGILAIGTAFLGLRAGIGALEDLADAGRQLSDITNQVGVNIGKMVSWSGRTKDFEDKLSSFNLELKKTSIYATQISESFEAGLTGAGFKNVSQIEFLTKRFELLAASQNRKLTPENAQAAAANLAMAVKGGGESGEQALQQMGLSLSWSDRLKYRAIQNYPGQQGQAYDAREKFIENLLSKQAPEGAFAAAAKNPYLAGYRQEQEQSEFTGRLGQGINNMFAPVQDAITAALQNMERNGEIEKFTAWSTQAGANIASFFTKVIEPNIPGALEALSGWFDKLGPKLDDFVGKISTLSARFDQIAGPIGNIINFLNKWDDVLYGKIAPVFFGQKDITSLMLPEGHHELQPVHGYETPGGVSSALGSGDIYGDRFAKKMAAGGIVNSPTYSLIGEGGPEAVIPLSFLGSDTKDITKANTDATKKSTDALTSLTQKLEDNLSFLQQQAIFQQMPFQGDRTGGGSGSGTSGGRGVPYAPFSGKWGAGGVSHGKSLAWLPNAEGYRVGEEYDENAAPGVREGHDSNYGPSENKINVGEIGLGSELAKKYGVNQGDYVQLTKGGWRRVTETSAQPWGIEYHAMYRGQFEHEGMERDTLTGAIRRDGKVLGEATPKSDLDKTLDKAQQALKLGTNRLDDSRINGKSSSETETPTTTPATPSATPVIHYSPHVTIHAHGHNVDSVKNALVDALKTHSDELGQHIERTLQHRYRDHQRVNYA